MLLEIRNWQRTVEKNKAGVMKLVNMHDSKSCAARFVGSSPTSGICGEQTTACLRVGLERLFVTESARSKKYLPK